MLELEYLSEVNAHIWRACRDVSGELRCGLLVNGCGGIEAWAQQTIELLVREPAITIEAIYALPAYDAPGRSRGGALFRWLNRESASAGSPLARAEFAVPNGVPVLALGTDIHENRARIAAANLDVLIWLESRTLELDCAGLARLGVWYLCCGDPDLPRTDPPYWKEVADRNAVSTLVLAQDTGGPNVRHLAVCHMATRPSVHAIRNAVEPLKLAGPLILRNLLDALEPGSRLPPPPARSSSQSALPPPGNLETAAVLARQMLRSASIRLRSRRLPGWFTAVRSNRESFRTGQDRFVPQGFRDVPSSANSQLADPFVVEDRGRHWLFVEEIPAGTTKGRLAVMELDSEGAPGKPTTILERPFHLSYPFVFRHESDFFMLPETSANRTIELYRATNFPFEWKLERILQSNVRAVDTTPFFLDGIWYFLTTSSRAGYETFLFWSHSVDGEWKYHPCNPICSDIRRARGAGPLFRSGGVLIRPAQDCSVSYGYAIALNRVLRISPTEYEEELIEVIGPTWRKGLIGTHTLCSSDSFEVIDGLRYGA